MGLFGGGSLGGEGEREHVARGGGYMRIWGIYIHEDKNILIPDNENIPTE